MRRLCILGGTFDPIHLAHLVAAQEAMRLAGLDRVIFVPAAIPPHKAYPDMAPAAVRCEMVEMAIRGNPAFDLSDIELGRESPSYTVDTLCEFRNSVYPDAEILLLIGEDNVRELPAWHRPEDIMRLCSILVASRPFGRPEPKERQGGQDGPRTMGAGGPTPSGCSDRRWLIGVDPDLVSRMTFLRTPLMEISSTDIRRRVALGRSIRYLVPEEVERYIHGKGLYRGGDMVEHVRPGQRLAATEVDRL